MHDDSVPLPPQQNARITSDHHSSDPAGNRTAKVNQLAAVTSNYTYDAIYQLTQATQGGSTTESYSFDPVGNRTASLGVSSYTTNASNEMTANSNVSYTYDSNGNTLTKTVGSNTTTYAWDYENRLTSVTLPGTARTVTFKYDPMGRRIEKVSPTFTSIFAYDGDNLIETVNSSGAVVARYTQTQNIDEPLAELRSSGTSYYEADGLGSITSLTSAAGAVANSYTYDSYGNLTASSGSVPNPFSYTGRELDSETGLYYYRARYYDPSAGRFASEDPIGFGGGNDFYSYVDNSPVSLIDPSGNAPCLDISNFVRALDNNALPPYGHGRCGHWVGWALTGNPNGHYPNGKDFGPYLSSLGFSQVPESGYQPQAGDVTVIQPYTGGNPAGHVEGYDGTNWVSDYIQPNTSAGIYPGSKYASHRPTYIVYRPTPCPTSTAEQGLIQQAIKWLRSLIQ
jgi:RHS repeat-associated protein